MSVEKPIKAPALGREEAVPSRARGKVAPFKTETTAAEAAEFDVNQFTPKSADDDEPEAAVGLDLSGVAKVIFVNGRGKTGKTTFLRWVAEQAVAADRPLLMADIDPTNASFSSYFSDVARPDTDDPAGVARWMQHFIEYAVQHQTSAVIDMGGGDTTLRQTAAEMPGFGEQIAGAGVEPVLISLVGTQPDDLAPIATLAERGFNPRARAIVFNEASAEVGLNRDQAFTRVLRNRVVLDQMKAGAVNLWMPRLHAASAVEARRSTFTEARDGLTTPPLGLFDRSRVRSWLDAMNRRFAGIRSWLP